MANKSTFDESSIENSFAENKKNEKPNYPPTHQILEESDDQCSATDDIKILESESSVISISDTSSESQNSTPNACRRFKSKMLHSTPNTLNASVNNSFETPQQISKRSKTSDSTPKDKEEIEKTYNCDSPRTSAIFPSPRHCNRRILFNTESDEEMMIFSNDEKVEPLDENETRKLRLILEKSKHIIDMDTELSDEGDSDSSRSSKSDDDSCCLVTENVPAADNDNPEIVKTQLLVDYVKAKRNHEFAHRKLLEIKDSISKTELVSKEKQYQILRKMKIRVRKVKGGIRQLKRLQKQLRSHYGVTGKEISRFEQQFNEESPVPDKNPSSDSDLSNVEENVTGKEISKLEQKFNEESSVPDKNPSSDSELSNVEENVTGKQISKLEQQFNEESPVPDTNPNPSWYSEFSNVEENVTGEQISKFEQQFNEESPVPYTISSDSEFSNVEENGPVLDSSLFWDSEFSNVKENSSTSFPGDDIIDIDSLDDYNPGPAFKSVPTNYGDSKGTVQTASTSFPGDDIIDIDSLDDYNPGPAFKSVPTNYGDSKGTVQTASTSFPGDDIIDIDSLDDYNPGPAFKSVPTNYGDSKGTVQTGPPKFNNLPSAKTKLSKLGPKALEKLRAQQAVTVGALEKLHKSLENFPDKNSLADDPVGLKVSLLPHQKYGLNWLLWRETQHPAGGLLADDMGLGKTLTMISLILKSKQTADEMHGESSIRSKSSSEDGEKPAAYKSKPPVGGTLVICPSSVLGQWETEVRNKVKLGSLSVLLYHGQKRETNVERIASYDIVLTTYALVQKSSERSPLAKIKWNRIILDEGHVIRNRKSQTAIAIFNLKRKNSWVLTGTPIHNKELDFYSLIKFIKVKPFNDLDVWKRWVDNQDAAGIERLNLITKTIMLRRTKAEIQNEGGLNSLKPKEFKVVKVQLDPEEYVVYEKVLHFSRTVLASFIHQRAEKENLLRDGISINNAKKHFMNFNSDDENPFKDHPELGRLHRNLMTMGEKIQSHEILVLLLRLRQICCHPSLATAIVEKEEMVQAGLEEAHENNAEMMEKMFNLRVAVEPNEVEGLEEKDKNHSILSMENPVFDKTRCSSKIRSVVAHLLDILCNTEDDKIIVVSQWTSVLNILHDVLEPLGIKTVALNGSIPVKERMPIIDEFNNQGSGPRVLLLSLTAGGTGLNLVGANHLLLIDIHWNPQLEAQACDRIYRFGQTKQVFIYKFICCDTIEESIEQLQKKKLDLAHGVLTGSMKISSNTLTLSDLKLLFNVQ